MSKATNGKSSPSVKGYGARRLLSEFPDRLQIGKYRHSVKENPKDGYDWSATGQRQTAFCVCQNAPIDSWDLTWNWHSPNDCAQNNSSRSAAQVCQRTCVNKYGLTLFNHKTIFCSWLNLSFYVLWFHKFKTLAIDGWGGNETIFWWPIVWRLLSMPKITVIWHL